MATYNVTITNDSQTHGVGPVQVTASTPQAAVELVAAAEGMTLDQLSAAGLTRHIVEVV